MAVPVRAPVRDAARAGALAGPQVKLVTGDLSHPESLAPAFYGVDKVLVLSALSPDAATLQGNAIAAAKRVGVKHLVRLSAMGTDHPSITAEALRVHRVMEEAVRTSGPAWTLIAPTFFMQSDLGNAATIAARSAFYAPAGDGKYAPIDIRDVAACAVEVLTGSGHEGRTYVLTGPELLSNHDIAWFLSEATGRPVKYVPVPPEAARVWGNVEKLLGRRPRRYAEFARDHAAAFRAAGTAPA
jgi:uncharacterized protein YbjT (DUF2867 family)